MTVDVSHGMGNHIALLEEGGQVSDFLLDTWLVNLLFTVNVPLGKFCAVSLQLALHENSRKCEHVSSIRSKAADIH